jgi:hypothetical protein
MTAPNFRPFEQKYENRRHRGRALFLSSDEGEDGEDEASESEEEEDEEDEASEREDKLYRDICAAQQKTKASSK